MMTDEQLRYKPFTCPNCNGYTTVSYGKRPCPTCKARGFLVIDQQTGLPVKDNDDENKNNQD